MKEENRKPHINASTSDVQPPHSANIQHIDPDTRSFHMPTPNRKILLISLQGVIFIPIRTFTGA